jgi:hypothetical protein
MPRQRPARPLTGYRDLPHGELRRRSHLRAWAILLVLVLVYLGWTLTVYFLEPGLR